MATADTAKLIALLELQDKFSKPLGNAERSLGNFDRRLSTAQRASQGFNRAIGTVAKVGIGAAVAGVGLLAVNVKAGVDAINELENVTVATNTVLESTNAVSGQTAEGIRAMSEEYENLNATMDDKVIQSGANMLLTFTNIREQAFEPALEAALNMNEAMGGGPDGLQTTIIQVGKALNDPIKGVGALRRVGVQLSAQQEDQIKTLVEQNDLYGAQQIILDELATQFGGRFAAAGKTAEGSQAALADRIEDVQKALAGPLIPAIDRVRDRLIDFLGSDRVLRGAEELGTAIAGLFTDENLDRGVALIEQGMDAITNADFSGFGADISGIASTVGDLPWESIADAARLLGTGSKALLDAFLGLPPWVQTAVLTGWGLNKLTGGAVGSIVGELGKGIIKGVLNMNAGVVNINAATVNGGPGLPGGKGGPGGFLGSLLGGLKTGLALGSIPLAGTAGVMAVDFVGNAQRQAEGINSKLADLPRDTGAEINESIDKVEAALQAANDGPLASIVSEMTGLNDRLETELAALREAGAQPMRGKDTGSRAQPVIDAESSRKLDRVGDKLTTVAGNVTGLGPRIDRVATTPHNVRSDVDVNVNTNVGVSVINNYMYRTTMMRESSTWSESTNSAGI